MAYGIKFRLDFDDWHGTTWRIDIKKNGYGGSVLDMNCAAVPVSIRWSGDGDHFNPIRGSECTINLVSESDFNYTELYTSNAREYLVQIIRDPSGTPVTFWTGFLLSEQYFEPLLVPPYYVSVVASDQLGLLDNYDYSDSSDVPYNGDETLLNMLVNALSETGLGLDIYSAVNLYGSSMTQTATKDPLFQSIGNQDVWLGPNLQYKKQGNYEPIDCKTVIHDVLTSFGAKIQQRNGAWWITRISELNLQFYWRGYDSTGTPLGTANGSLTPTVTLTNATNANPIVMTSQSQTMEITPAYRNLNIKQNYGLKDNLIVGGNFPYWEVPKIGTFTNWIKFNWPGNQVQRWNNINHQQTLSGVSQDYKPITNWFTRLGSAGEDTELFPGNIPNIAKYFACAPIAVEASTQFSVYVSFDLYRDNADYSEGVSEGSVWMDIRVTAPGPTIYTWNNIDREWQTVGPLNYIELKELTGNAWNKISIDTGKDTLPATGDLEIRFYRIIGTAQSTFYYIDNVNISLSYSNTGSDDEEKPDMANIDFDKHSINKNYTFIMPEKEMIFSDAPQAPTVQSNKRVIWNGTLGYGTTGSNSPTTTWENVIQGSPRGDDDQLNLHLRNDIISFRQASFQKVGCEIYEPSGNTITIISTMSDPYNQSSARNRLFIWDDVEYEPKRNIWRGDMLEMPISSAEDVRITEDADTRITEASDTRIISQPIPGP